MKVGLFYFWGLKNSGDMAINLGAIRLIKSLSVDEILMISRFDENSFNYVKSKEFMQKHSTFFEKTTLYPGPYTFERETNKIKLVSEYLTNIFSLKHIVKNEHLNKVIDQSDIILFNGGNLMRINSLSDFIRLIAIFIPIKLAKKKNRKVILLPHSTNKMNKMQKWLMSKFINNFDYIFSREEMSYQFFNEISSSDVDSQIDLCFFKNIESLIKREIPSQVKRIAITVRKTGIGDIGYLADKKIEQLKVELINYVSAINGPNLEVVIVNQTEKDLTFSEEVLTDLINKEVNAKLVVEYDTFLLEDLYSTVDLVIGMRLHSLILAASMGTPVVGLFSEEWGIKNRGTLDILGLKSFLLEGQSEEIHNIVSYNIKNFSKSRNIIIEKHKKIKSVLQSYF